MVSDASSSSEAVIIINENEGTIKFSELVK